jgi:hypothetical protein
MTFSSLTISNGFYISIFKFVLSIFFLPNKWFIYLLLLGC